MAIWALHHYEGNIGESLELYQLDELSFGISGCELTIEPGPDPYYSPPIPTILSEAEKQHFAILEKLYLQTGMLTELKSLVLKIVKFDGQGQAYTPSDDEPSSFPAMLSLGDIWTGRPGCLGHLAGLKKMGSLTGSVHADSEENKATMEWREVVWMPEQWPHLKNAEFFSCKKNARPPFVWVRNPRTIEGRKELSLGYH
ncbi:hypothetical protein BGX33_002199 [Mortierella sp. NVP41]|nr:hypothetical protein BGX33_002199 [Mortierella sp. NVP41]